MAIRMLVACVLFTGLAGLAPSLVADAQAGSDADSQEVNRYVLDEAGLAKYAQASRALATALADNPPDCSEQADGSLTAMAARLDAVPGARAALQGAGMDSREYIVFGFATFQAGMGSWALTQGDGALPPGVSQANVDFYEQHEAELQELSALVPRDACSDDAEGEWDDAEDSEYDG